MIGIYKIINPNGKIYIGQSINIERRWERYYYTLNCKEQPRIFNSLKKYKVKNHHFEIIELCSLSKLDKLETYWKQFYLDKLGWENVLFCELHDKGGGPKSDETRKKLSKSHSTSEFKNKMSKIHKGKIISKKTRLKMSKARNNHPMYNNEWRNNIMKPIYQFDLQGIFIKKYNGAADAIKEIGRGNSNNINDCARGKYKATYGFQWKYEKDIQDLNNLKMNPVKYEVRFNRPHTKKSKLKISKANKGRKKSKEYAEKIRQIKSKPVYQIDINNNLINKFPSFKSMNGSKVIGTKKLRTIINKNIYYKGYKFSYKHPEILELVNV